MPPGQPCASAQLFSKKSDTCNEEIPKNDYAEYIDVANKQITLPNEIATCIPTNPAAMDATNPYPIQTVKNMYYGY
jgi:hypothetical protein